MQLEIVYSVSVSRFRIPCFSAAVHPHWHKRLSWADSKQPMTLKNLSQFIGAKSLPNKVEKSKAYFPSAGVVGDQTSSGSVLSDIKRKPMNFLETCV